MVNDCGARELSGDWNIYRAARWILARGPRLTVVKQGEHGALLVSAEATFKVPAYPLQEVFDPTGAGDAFAGGFMGYLASTGDVSDASLRRAMVYGAALGSFAVEAFGVEGLADVPLADVRARVRAFRDLVHFDMDEANRPLPIATPRRASISTRPTRRSAASRSSSGGRARSSRSARWARSVGWSGCRPATSARSSCSPPTASAPRCWSPRAPASTTRWARTS